MQYRNLIKGQTVLYSYDRTSSPDFHLPKASLVTVVALGVEHHYRAKGGFAGGGGPRSTDQGVLVRRGADSTREPSEFVTLAAHLLPYAGDTRIEWDEAQVQIAARKAEKERHTAVLDDLSVRFKLRGFDVHVLARDAASAPSIHLTSLADVERLLAWIENSPGPLS